MTAHRSRLAPRYYAHEVELLPEQPLRPLTERPLPAHWPTGDPTYSAELRAAWPEHAAELDQRFDVVRRARAAGLDY